MGIYALGKRKSAYGLYLRLDGVAPFVFYVEDVSEKSYEWRTGKLDRCCESYQKNFSEYLKGNNEQQFTVKSKADTGKLLLCIIYILIMLPTIFAEDISRIINKNNGKTGSV